MFAETHYVPVLKWKRGEQRALRELDPSIRAGMTPLLEMTFNPDLDSGEPPHPLPELVDSALDVMSQSWLKDRPFFLDPAMFAMLHEGGGTGTGALFDAAQERALPFVPVVRLAQSEEEVRASLGAGRNLCLRLGFDASDDGLEERVSRLLKTHQLQLEDVDLVLDFGALPTESVGVAARLARCFVEAVPHLERWRTLTLLATSFPAHMGGVPSGGDLVAPRMEWLVWSQLFQERKLKRTPAFGDYAIQHPEGPEDYDPRKMPMSACVRYTCDREWLFIKGVTTKLVPPGEQFPALAARLTEHPRFCGDEHCRGCGDAAACAQGAPSLSSPEQWRRIGTVHHLTMALRQLAALPRRA